MLKRLACIVLALVLIVHSLIHLGIIPGGLQGPDGRTEWSGQCNEYQEVEGIRIPTRIEITWHFASGEFTWFRVKITESALLSQPAHSNTASSSQKSNKYISRKKKTVN